MHRVAGDTEERALRNVDIMEAVKGRDVDTLSVYVKNSDNNAMHVAVKCVLRFIIRQETPSILERQLLCFLHNRKIDAGQIILMVSNGVRLGYNPHSVWLEWCVSSAMWQMTCIPTAVMEWVSKLKLPLSRQDTMFCDHLFFNWPGSHDQMKSLLMLTTADGSTLFNLLLRRTDVCFTTTMISSGDFHPFVSLFIS